MNRGIVIFISLILTISVVAQTPIKDEELKKVFPTTISSFQRTGELEGITLNIEGTSFSNATAKYKKGSVTIEIVIIDYADSKEMFESSALNVNEELDYKSGGTFAKTFTMDGKKGYVMGDKKANTTTMILVWGERFVLNVSVNGKYDEAFIKAIYKEIDLSILL